MGCCCCCFPPTDWGRDARSTERTQSRSRTARPAQTQSSYCDICGLYVHPSLIDNHREACRCMQRQASERQSGQGNSLRHGSSARFDPDALKKQLPTTDEDVLVNPDDYPIEALCVVCLERLRCYAFLPCGHVVCCRDCAARCDSCPVCRGERAGLCFVPPNTVAQYHCKRCGCFIAPAIFDGHREVCALRMRQLQQQKDAEEAERNHNTNKNHAHGSAVNGSHQVSPTAQAVLIHSDDKSGPILAQHDTEDTDSVDRPGAPHQSTSPLLPPTKAQSPHRVASPTSTPAASPPTTAPAPRLNAPLNMCLECQRTDDHLVITLPCGHRVLCVSCAKKRTSCPVCYQNIAKVLVTYE